jgi:hypothetical protein
MAPVEAISYIEQWSSPRPPWREIPWDQKNVC